MRDDPDTIYVPPVLENPVKDPGDPEEQGGAAEPIVPPGMPIIDEGEVMVPGIETGPDWVS